MANNSVKKNQQNIRGTINWLTWIVYGLIGWCIGFNSFFLVSAQISIWHFLLCALISGLSYFALTRIIYCWEMRLPDGAADYYYDILVLNLIVQLIDPYSHYVWHVYWILVAFALYLGGKWLWAYIQPKYVKSEDDEQGEEGTKKKEKKEKKDKIKYIKR